MRRALAGAIAIVALWAVACGGDDSSRSGDASTGPTAKPTELEIPTTLGTDKGRQLTGSSGCLGCHRIGESGNAGLGPELTHIGRRLTRAKIERILVDPEPPMPSFEAQPRADRREIARFLASLR